LSLNLRAACRPREDQLDAADLLLRVDVDRHAAAVVLDRDGAVLVQRDGDVLAVPGQRLVDAVVDDLVHEVVRAPRVGVHAGRRRTGSSPLRTSMSDAVYDCAMRAFGGAAGPPGAAILAAARARN
jgi:hypothetical protein